jgi:microcystin-dependent protein
MPSNNGGLSVWSKIAANNASADNTVNWAEGQAPSSINDSARAMMTSAAKYRDDISGAIVTTGTSAAYQVASNQNFVNLTDFNGQMIAFTPHVTNAAGPVTITVDGFANLPLRSSPGKELPAGVLVQGTPYVALYNNTDGALYLQGFYGNPYSVPLGGMIDYVAATTPNSSFAFPIGQAISRITYAALFSIVGTTYGTGDGSTTFNVPDLRGRVVAGLDTGNITGRLNTGGMNGSALGSAGGEQTHTLVAAEIPTITSTASPTLAVTTNLNNFVASNSGDGTLVSAGGSGGVAAVSLNVGPTVSKLGATGTATGTVSSASNNTGGTAHNNIQPTIVLNKILRII